MTPTEILASVTERLLASGYAEAADASHDWPVPARLFEDVYGIVVATVFDTTEDLLDSWADLQERVVELISSAIEQTDAKAWDGYLVLLTPGPGVNAAPQLQKIRSDVRWLRKIVATGEELEGPEDVHQILRPLAPLSFLPVLDTPESALDEAERLLADTGMGIQTASGLLSAFRDGTSLMDVLAESVNP